MARGCESPRMAGSEQIGNTDRQMPAIHHSPYRKPHHAQRALRLSPHAAMARSALPRLATRAAAVRSALFGLFALLLGTLAALPSTAQAAQAADDGDRADDRAGIALQFGAGPQGQRSTLAWQSPVLWRRAERTGAGRLEATVELGVSYWQARGEREPCCVWQLSAVPLLRWWPGSGPWFVEGGIGATLFSHTHFADRAISTAFQFGDMVGVGYQLTPDLRVGLRLAHFSNADIKRPNPGLNVLQLSLTKLY